MEMGGLNILQNISYDMIDKNNMPDVADLEVDTKKKLSERLKTFLDEIKNPYIMQCGKTIVEVEFSNSKKTIDSQIKSYLKSLKTG